MIPFVLLSLTASARAGVGGPVLGGHEHFMGEQTLFLKRGHGDGIAHFGGGHLPHHGPVLIKGNHAPVAHGPPVFIKGHGGPLLQQGPPILIKGGGGPLLPQGPPIFFKEAGLPQKAGVFGAHAHLAGEAPLIIKGNLGTLPHGGSGGHAPILQGPPIIFKNAAHETSHPFVQGAPIILRGGFNAGFGHGAPVLKGGGHAVQGPTILLKAAPGHALKGGHPIILKGGFAESAGGAVRGFGHEQHAVAGPSYLITTVHHVQKVSGGGKLIASFGGASGHAKTIGIGHVLAKGW